MAFIVHFGNGCGNVCQFAVCIVEIDLRSDARVFAGTNHDPPIVRRIFFQQQNFKLAAGFGVHAAQSGGNDARIVQYKHVAVAEKFQKIAEFSMFNAGRSLRFKTNSRDSSRLAAGCCAINSGGRAKSKSAVRIAGSFKVQI